MAMDPAGLTAAAALQEIGAGRLSAAAVREACVARVTEREGVLRALSAFDEAAVREAAPRAGRLTGLPFGIKDVLDTAALPTEYGSAIWRGHRPTADAACVAWARAAGGVPFGKTVTTEFATRAPGPTTNPHDPGRTPGGSSSGSAAGVAAGYFPFAFGTQTAGSVIRPASYCGVVGYKPSFGTIDRAGMKVMSASLDTIGVLARSVADCALLVEAASGLELRDVEAPLPRALRIGLCRSPMWERRAPETDALWDRAVSALGRTGAVLADVALPPSFEALEAAHRVVMNGESGRALGWEMAERRDSLSAGLRDNLDWGLAQGGAALVAARQTFRRLQDEFDAWMGEWDVLVTPAAPGIAPVGLEWTGDPAFNLLWTALHVPCVTVPAGTGPAGMPLGLQVVGRRERDAECLQAAAAVGRVVG